MPVEHAVTNSRISYPEYSQEEYRHLLRTNGHVYMDNIPADFDHFGFLERLGVPLPQYDGELVWSIKADPRYEHLYHSLNTRELAPHTECSEFESLPPRYLALWCLVPPADGKGQTLLADIYAFLETLTPAERIKLAARHYQFTSTAGLQSMRLGRAATHPILENRAGLPPVVRFSYNCMHANGDRFALDILDRVLQFADQTQAAIDFTTGSLLVWDNHRVVHARTAYNDHRRHLRRVWLAER